MRPFHRSSPASHDGSASADCAYPTRRESVSRGVARSSSVRHPRASDASRGLAPQPMRAPEHGGGPDASQATAVMLAASRLDDSARSGVDRADESSNHPRQSTSPATASPDPGRGKPLPSDGVLLLANSAPLLYDSGCYL